MSVRRNEIIRVFKIAVGSSGIATPSITSPSNDSIGQPSSMNITSTEFSSIPAGLDTLEAVEWQVARDSGFFDIIEEETNTSTTFSVSGLPANTTLFVRGET